MEKSLQAIKIWNFLTHEWDSVEGKSIHTGNIEAVATKEKAKFPQHFFPEVRNERNCLWFIILNLCFICSANGHAKDFYEHDGKLRERSSIWLTFTCSMMLLIWQLVKNFHPFIVRVVDEHWFTH